VLSEASPLLPLIAEELGQREPPDWLPQLAGLRRNHASESRRHFRSQSNVAVALVPEIVELAYDLFTTLRRVEIEWLERWTVVLLETIAAGNCTPGLEDVGTEREISGVKITEARQGPGFHGGSISGSGVSGKRQKSVSGTRTSVSGTRTNVSGKR
jgi:hypothetical protein